MGGAERARDRRHRRGPRCGVAPAGADVQQGVPPVHRRPAGSRWPGVARGARGSASSNEELQSTNEELETTKEELQSANEELTTVNEQFQSRNRELDVLTDDLSNFITSADLPMVTVGRDLCVRRLTPAAERAFNLLPADVGRSIDHIKFSLAIERVGDVIETVIAAMQPWEREVRDRDGR
jgi:two-component system, chemotaxis family, CheB/CheR fusion protein